MNINAYRNKKSDELSRKLSEFDNRGAQANHGLRNQGYRINDPNRYKSSNYELSENNLPHKGSIEHSNSVSGIELRNNARYRVESGNKMSVQSDGRSYGNPRHQNQVVAPNSNLNGLSRVYGK